MSLSRIEHLRTLRTAGGWFPVEGKVQIAVSGADSLRYLNGQLTVDVTKLQARQAKSALLLTARGKLCAPVQIWKAPEAFILETEAALMESIQERLERYIISDDVTLSTITPESPVFHVFGTGTAGGNVTINRMGVDGFDALVPPADRLRAEPADLEFLRIERGLPRWGPELDADTLPQEARLEDTSVDFDKGCYVGQEVVSRLKSVGRVNKRLFAFAGVLDPTREERLSLFVPGSFDHPAGVLTSRCLDFELAQTIALGYLNRQFEDSKIFLAADAAGNVLGKFEKRPILN